MKSNSTSTRYRIRVMNKSLSLETLAEEALAILLQNKQGRTTQ